MSGFGVYIHVPFCQSRCTYCDFNTVTGMSQTDQRRYYEALVAEWSEEPLPEGSVRSIFFGGGTPSLAPPEAIHFLVEAVASRRPFAPDIEITMEMNPGTVSRASLAGYRAARVNRVSLGVQAAQDEMLARLNRHHTFDEAVEAVRLVRQVGFQNLSLDAIYGLPGQTREDWQATVTKLLALDPDHLSLYQLQVETGTPLERDVSHGRLMLPDDDATADMAEWAEETLPQAGLFRYEVSNFSRPGKESVHNRLYWELANYVGIGAGAHSFWSPRRWWNQRGVRTYMDMALSRQDPVAGSEDLSASILAGEYAWLGLRQVKGISAKAFQERFGLRLDAAFPGVLERLHDTHLVESDGDWVRLTPRGMAIGNQVFQQFLTARL